jgi:hypothetical protein
MKQKISIAAVLLSFGMCFAQLGLEIGTSCFAADERSKTWVEIFTKFDRNKLTFTLDGEKNVFVHSSR